MVVCRGLGMTHLSGAGLGAWYDAGAERDRVLAHLACCDDCGARLAELVRLDAPVGPAHVDPSFVERGYRAYRPTRQRRNRSIAAAAAIAATVLVAVGVWVQQSTIGHEAAPVQETATTRGTRLRLTSPLGTVRPPLVFVWESPVAAAQYRVEVREEGRVIYSERTTSQRLDASDLAARLGPGRTYVWN